MHSKREKPRMVQGHNSESYSIQVDTRTKQEFPHTHRICTHTEPFSSMLLQNALYFGYKNQNTVGYKTLEAVISKDQIQNVTENKIYNWFH